MRFPTDSMLKVVLTNNDSIITRIADENDFVVHAIRVGQNVMKIIAHGNGTSANALTLGYRSFKNYKIVLFFQTGYSLQT
jgi:hypothetical protein